MSKSHVFTKAQNLLGRRVSIKGDKFGTLRYFGNTQFAHGLWCGVELDEAVGENDGMKDNIRYFTCKENCGIFIPSYETNILCDEAPENNLKAASTLLTKDNITPEETSDVDFKIENYNLHASLSDGSQSDTPKNALNESYIISKGSDADKLPVIAEETFESDKYQDFPSVKQLLELAPSSFINKESEVPDLVGSSDSDESLGILPHVIAEEQNLIGQRVSIKGDKFGTLRYFGNTQFAHGLWCGVELDEAVGENDGMKDNIRYFTCKENYGIFIPSYETNICDEAPENNLKAASTLLTKDNITPEETSDVDFNIENFNLLASLSDGSQSYTPKNALNESYIISRGSHTDKLCVITKETFESVKDQDSVSFSCVDSKTDFSKFENVPSVKQLLEQTPSSFINEVSEVPDLYLVESSDSDESLGILSHLLDDKLFLDDLILDVDNLSTDLNTTVILPNTGVELKECQIVTTELNTNELISSPICIMPNVSLFTKSDESPVYNTTSTPKYASTPKQENNCSYVMDEKAPLSTQNFSCDFQSNKVLEKGVENKKNSAFAQNNRVSSEHMSPIATNALMAVIDENENSDKNILNVTCNILEPLNANQSPLNKTFDNITIIIDETCTLPCVKSHDEPDLINKLTIQSHTVDVLKTDSNPFIQHLIPEESGAVSNDSQLPEEQENVFFEDENILNRTCNIAKIPNTDVIKNLEQKENSENQKGSAINVLNTTLSFPGELESKFETLNEGENIAVHDKTKVLNTTYEKIDDGYKLPRGNENVKSLEIDSKSKCKKSISVPISDSASLKDESRNKGITFDRKKRLRKSVGCFGRSNIPSAELKNEQTQNRRNSCASTSSKNNETIIISPSHDKDMATKCSVTENTTSIKKGFIDPNTGNISKRTEEVKSYTEVQLKSSEKSLLNETINLSPPVPNIEKTVIKKPKIPVNFPYKKTSEMCELPKARSKSMIPSNKKKSSLKISMTAEKDASEKTNEGVSASFNKSSPVKSSGVSAVTVEEKLATRIPERQVLSQKNVCPNISSATKGRGLVRPRSAIPALKSANDKNKQASVSRKAVSQLAREVNLNDTILISDHESCSEKCSQGAAVKRNISGASKAERPVQSRIPSISKSNKKEDTGVKSSLMTPRTGSTARKRKSPTRYNLR